MTSFRIKKNKILIVEDYPMNALLMEDILRSFEMEVHSVKNCDEALKHIEAHPVDLIFIDINLQGSSGIELAKTIRDNTSKTLPLIGFSGDTRPEIKTACLEAGMNDFFLKPIAKDVIKEILIKFDLLQRRAFIL